MDSQASRLSKLIAFPCTTRSIIPEVENGDLVCPSALRGLTGALLLTLASSRLCPIERGRQSPSEARRARNWGRNFKEHTDGGAEGTNVVESLESPTPNKGGGFKVGRVETGEVDRVEGGNGLPLFELLSSDGTFSKVWIHDEVDRVEVDCAEPGGEGNPVRGVERTEDGREESNVPSGMLQRLSVVLLASEAALGVLASESLELRRFSGDDTIPGRALSLGLGLSDGEYLL